MVNTNQRPCIAFFHLDFNGAGGVERFVSIWAAHFAQKGYRVILISLHKTENFLFPLPDGVELINLNLPTKRMTLWRPLIAYRLWTICKKYQCIAIIGQCLKASYLLGWACQYINLPAIGMEHISYHCPAYIKKQQYVRQTYFRYLKAVVTLTPEDVPHYKNIGVAYPCCIFNPVEIAPNVNYSTNSRLIVSVGRQDAQKNQTALLKAFALAQKNEPDLQLAIIGQDQGERPKLQLLASELGIEKYISFYDFTLDVGLFYQKAAIFALTSDYEGLPLALLEAKNHGIPCISYDCPTGPKQIIRHGIDGYLVDMGQEAVFADRIVELIRNSSLRIQMSQACRQDISTRFNITEISKQWVDIFKEINTV